MGSRLNAKPWRHDSYTLNRLQVALENAISDLVSQNILRDQDSLVLDIGAGDAPYRDLFRNYAKRYLACDLEAGPNIDLVFKEGEPLDLPSGIADCVLSAQVLEHVWDLDAYLGECRRCLTADGRLLISTHGTWLYHPHPGDYRRWTRDGLCRELESRGFEVVAIRPVVGPLAWTTQFRTLAYHRVLSALGGLGRLVASGVCLLMYLRMRVEDRVTPKSLRDSNAAVYVVTARVKQ